MKKLLSALSAGAMVAAGVSLLSTPGAVAAPGDGALTVRVVNDLTLDDIRNSGDAPLGNVAVKVTDAAGASLTLTTNAQGVATLPANNSLAGGKYRVEVTNPDPARYSDADIRDGHTEPQFTPTVSFVDLTSGNVEVSVGYKDNTRLGLKNATVYSAIMPNSIWGNANDSVASVYKIPFFFQNSVAGVPKQDSPVNTVDAAGAKYNVGAVYGFAMAPKTKVPFVFMGAYAKRGSLYGPGGPGGIYRLNALTGLTELYATVPDAGTTAHEAAHAGLDDYAFRKAVSRESLGDIEISEDGKWLTAVNMHTDSLVVFPVQNGTNPAPVQTLPVPDQGCASDWTPAGLKEKGDKLYVTAICGGNVGAGKTDTYIFTYTRAANGTLSLDGAPITAVSHDVTPQRNTQVAGNQSNFWPIGSNTRVCGTTEWFPFADDLPQDCLDAINAKVQPAGQGDNKGGQITHAQPLPLDLEINDKGEFVMSFRDRASDMYGAQVYAGQGTDGAPRWSEYIATGDLVTVHVSGNTATFSGEYLDWSSGGVNPVGNPTEGPHKQSAYSGIVTIPGTDRIVGNQMDALGFNASGLRAWNQAGGIDNTANLTTRFRKGAGLADLEAQVLEATQQIGNRLWIDVDKDGIQDPDERPIAGVQVSLYDAAGTLIATTETDANGEYWFETADGLKPNTAYEVRLDRDADFAEGGPLFEFKPTKVGAGSNTGIDSNGVADPYKHVYAALTTPDPGVNDHSIDFGFIARLVSIGDYLWIDTDKDGVQNAGEPVVPAGTTVELLDMDGNVVATTTTDGDGYYVFADLPRNTQYQVKFPTTVEVGGKTYGLTDATQGGDTAKDSNPAPATGLATVTTPATGENSSLPGKADDPTIDAGYKLYPVSIGDYLWIDANGNGTQDADEKPVPAGTTVELLDKDGTKIGETTTDANGYYAFKDLEPSTDYQVKFPTQVVAADGKTYDLIAPGAGTDTTVDSNPNQNTGVAKVTTPAIGSNSVEPGKADNPTIDAGYTPVLVSVGDYLWIDADGDGIQDAGEKPVAAGTTVELLDKDGTKIGETTTDANGFYAFTGLNPNSDYTVKFPTRVKDADGNAYDLTQQTAGTDTTQDSNPAPTTGLAPVKTPATGSNSAEPGKVDVPTIDAGYTPVKVSIGDYLWIDADGDGVQDATEKPVPAGTKVELLDKDGTKIGETTTDANGYYAFGDLKPDTEYQVKFPTRVSVGAESFDLTQTGAGTSATDSNPNQGSGIATVTTPSTGSNSLEPGKADDPSIDAGYAKALVSIGDYLWIDANGNGLQDPAEQPVAAGTKVELLDKDGTKLAETTTDANGYYAFTGLNPGQEYQVKFPTRVTTSDGKAYDLTDPKQGTDTKADSNPDTSTGVATVTTPDKGSNSAEPGKTDNPTIDAGYVPVLVSIGDHLWVDADKDGIQDADEKPVAPGTTVKLLDKDGTVVATTTTDATGFYVFTGLNPGTDYIVEFPTRVKDAEGNVFDLTAPGQGDDPAKDSNPNPDTGRAPVKTPATGSNSSEPGKVDVPTIDAGYVPVKVSIGDYLWIDADKNGIQDAGEKPVAAGTKVELLDKDGTKLAETTTDANGYYAFGDLTPDTEYQVKFPTRVTTSDGKAYDLTQTGAGTPGTDSNPDQGSGIATVTTPSTGSNSLEPGKADDPSIDAGYLPVLVSIGDRLWIDANKNGIQDGDEKPVAAGTTVELLDKDGKKIAETTTDAQGFYVFTGLNPGQEYQVRFPTRVKDADGKTYDLTDPNRGDDPSADSNPDKSTGVATVTTPDKGSNSAEPGKVDVPTIDAGYVPVLVSLGDYLWIDKNGNGIQDAGEKPVAAGTKVELLDKDGKKIAETTTDANGYYVFTGLNPDTKYQVKFPTRVTDAAGIHYDLTKPTSGSDPAKDSNPDRGTGIAVVTTPSNGTNAATPGESDQPTIDAGYVQARVSVGDYVWIDKNGNGIQDAGEKPVAGVKVELFDKDGKKIAETTTDGAGYYAFTGLNPDTKYTIKFPTTVKINGKVHSLTTSGAGSDRGKDSDPDGTGSVSFTSPTSGNNSGKPGQADLPSIDAGYKAGKVTQPTTPPTTAPPTDGGTGNGNHDGGDDGDTSGGPLPDTGAEFTLWGIGAGLLALIAGVGVLTSRRRTRH